MKRLHSILLLVFCFSLVAAAPLLAQTQLEIQDAAINNAVENNNTNLEDHSNNIYLNTLGGMVRSSMRGDPVPVPDPTTESGYRLEYSGGVVADLGRHISMIYANPPANTETYVADLMQNMGIAQPAYAQGIGFASLSPILDTWKVFRNVAYFFFIVLFLLIGFMIMLRQKIGGQTVVTAQQAIPHIIVSLLFVTFSYAIAGFLIDLMYVFMFMILGLFGHIDDSDQFIGMNFLVLGFKMVTAGAGTAYDVVNGFAESSEASLGEFGSEAVGFLGGLTMSVVVAVAIALNVFRLFFELLKTYISIVLMIVFSPILLMIGAIPGKDVFKGWVQNIIGNLAAFPTVLVMLIVFDELTGGFSGGADNAIEQGGFLPPYLFGRSGSGASGALTFAVGLGILLVMPEIVKQVKKALGVKEGIFEQLAGDVGQSLKRGWEGGEMVKGIGATKLPGAGAIAKWGGDRVEQFGAPVVGQVKNRLLMGGPREVIPRGVPRVKKSPVTPTDRPQTLIPRDRVAPSEKGSVIGKEPPADY
jgi:hypothetical protein